LERAHWSLSAAEYPQVRKLLAAGQEQATLMRGLGYELDQGRVLLIASTVAPLKCAFLEEGFQIIEHQQTASLLQEVDQEVDQELTLLKKRLAVVRLCKDWKPVAQEFFQGRGIMQGAPQNTVKLVCHLLDEFGRMGQAPSLLLVAVGYLVLQVTINMLQVALSAILPDQVPVRQRATISGLSAGPGLLLGGLFGQILVAQFFKSIPVAYIALAVSIAIMVALFLLVLREVPLPREHSGPLQLKQVSGMLKPLGYRDFALVWVARCLMLLGYTTVVTFMFFYLQNVVHYTQVFPGQSTAQGVQAFFAVNVLSIIITAVVGGIISDKLLRRKAFVIAAGGIMSVGLLLLAFFSIPTRNVVPDANSLWP
jgi:MFS family permease